MKQTAVDWLIDELGEYFPHEIGGIEYLVKKAKAIEEEQIKNAYSQGREDSGDFALVNVYKYTSKDYYNETFNRNEK